MDGSLQGRVRCNVFKFGREIVGNVMQKLGELIGLNAFKSKLIAGNAPGASLGLKVELAASRSGGRAVNLLDESIPQFRGGETLTLGGKHLLDVPEPSTFIAQGAFDWLATQHKKLIDLVDTSLDVEVQLRLLEKGYDAIRKAAQAGMIDAGILASFAEKTFRPSVKQLTEIVRAKLGKANGSPASSEAVEKGVLAEMRTPVVGCFIAGTLVHTKDGLKPIEEIKVGDWVLSRPENPEDGTATAYKRVANTFRFENKPVVSLSWFQRPADDPTGEKYGGLKSIFDWVFATPNHPVWVEGHGWMAVERLHAPGKRRFGSLSLQEWERPLLRLANGNACHISDVNDCFRTDKPNVVYTESTNEFLDWGSLWDSEENPPKYIDNGIAFDTENWIDPETDMPVVFTTTVYNIEVEDWHTYFVGTTGLWVHNTDCNHFEEELLAFDGAQQLGQQELKTLVTGALEYRGKATNGKTYKQFAEAELNAVIKEMSPDSVKGSTFVKVHGTDKYANEAVGSTNLDKASLIFEENGPGRMTTKKGLRVEFAVLRANGIVERMLQNGDLEKKTFDRLTKFAFSKFENSYHHAWIY